MASSSSKTIPEVFADGHPLSKGADVVLVSSGPNPRRFHVHKLVLTMWSKLLADVLHNTEEPSIQLTDSADDLLLLLGCMYPAGPSRTELSPLNVERLLTLADKYHCPDLILQCANFLASSALPLMEHTQLQQSSEECEASLHKVVRWMGLAQSYNLEALAKACHRTLGCKFFEWDVQGHMSAALQQAAPGSSSSIVGLRQLHDKLSDLAALDAPALQEILLHIPKHAPSGSGSSQAAPWVARALHHLPAAPRIPRIIPVMAAGGAVAAPPPALPLVPAGPVQMAEPFWAPYNAQPLVPQPHA